MKKLLKSRYFGTWILLAITGSLLYLLIYLAFQQQYRQNANDPQVRMTQDIALSLEQGTSPYDFNSDEKLDITQSLSPFTVIYDESGNVQASTGQLDQNEPVVPARVLTWAAENGESRVTWQPQKEVRIALVAVPYQSYEGNGFIAVGRSLREVEQRICTLGQAVLSMWLASLLLTACAAYILERASTPKTKKKTT